MSIPTTPLKFPLEGKPVDTNGNWTPTWHRAMQGLFTRTGANTAPSNLQLATAIANNVQGAGASVDGDVAVYSGTSGLLIKDTGVSVASLVVGAVSAVDGDIALFSGITGKIVKDSGVNLSALATVASLSAYAPLASPALTGTPTVPTATAGTNTTQAASTAFVTTAVGAAALTASSFSAHNNGAAQSIPNAAFAKLTLGTADFNIGTNYSTANSRWTPPANRLVMLVGAVALPTAASTLTTIAIYKNGSIYKNGTQLEGVFGSDTVATVSCVDIPNGTDYYELWAFQNTGIAQNTIGTASLTYFQGTSIQA